MVSVVHSIVWSQPIKGHLAKERDNFGSGPSGNSVSQDLGQLAMWAPAISVNQFEAGQIVDVTGQSKGSSGWCCDEDGVILLQGATHGNSLSHRAPGAINCQTPGRVFQR